MGDIGLIAKDDSRLSSDYLIPDKYLLNMYLLNPTPGKDWIIRLGAYYIRTTNSHDHERMIDPPDKCWDVCNMPLHVPDKYLSLIHI